MTTEKLSYKNKVIFYPFAPFQRGHAWEFLLLFVSSDELVLDYHISLNGEIESRENYLRVIYIRKSLTALEKCANSRPIVLVSCELVFNLNLQK